MITTRTINIISILCITGCIGTQACEDIRQSNTNFSEDRNTLNESSVGNGRQGYIGDYFYNFDDNIFVEFYRYDNLTFNIEYDQYRYLYHGEEPPILTLRTFPDYLLEISPDEKQYTDRTLINSTSEIWTDSVLISSIMFRNINSLVWDAEPLIEFQRYKPVNSDWVYSDVKVLHADTLSSYYYRAVIDTPMIDTGILFVDSGEMDSSMAIYAPDQKQFSHVFNFTRKQINRDSLMYRINTDCNDNGVWNESETILNDSIAGAIWDDERTIWFLDEGNGIWDPAELFYDINDNGIRDNNEAFSDRNCNGEWDSAEEYQDPNANGIWDEGEPFTDKGNRIFDADEDYIDLNNNGIGDPDELFLLGMIPNNLLVNWTNPQNPEIKTNINPGDSLTTRWGITYHDLIEVSTFQDTQTVFVEDIDSAVTLYTNQVIEHIMNDDGSGAYNITKTEWLSTDPVSGIETRDYDYLLFRQDEHLYKLIHPAYFKPYGYYWQPSQIEEGFWYKQSVADEVLYYTYSGLIRDGERIVEEYYDTTAVAIYQIAKIYIVNSDSITLPSKQVRGYISNGTTICYSDTLISASSPEDCPAVDTTLADCFRITREMTMTLVGSGVEYGEKNITWLSKGLGIVKDDLYIRWSEPIGSEDQYWLGLSRWELGTFSSEPSGARSLDRLLAKTHSIRINGFEQINQSHNDPYKVRRTSGLQRVGSR